MLDAIAFVHKALHPYATSCRSPSGYRLLRVHIGVPAWPFVLLFEHREVFDIFENALEHRSVRLQGFT